MSISRRAAAEAVGTFWLVFGGCGSAVLAANFPEVGDRPGRRLARLRPYRSDYEYVLRDATDEIRLDPGDALRAQQALEADAEVKIVSRVNRTLAPSDEFVDREPVGVKIVVERLQAAQ